MHINHRYRGHTTAVAAAFVILLFTQTALGQSAWIDPQAADLLEKATAYLAKQERFRVATRNTIEVVLASGQKLQFDSRVDMSLQRPNKLQAERHGDLVDQVFYYDGQSLTLHNPGTNHYATVPAPGTVEAMLDFARESLDIVAPAGDLVYRNAFEILMADVISGFVVGKSVVEGQRCDHLAFRNTEVDWQIWIQEGDQPLTRKLVITSKDAAGMPQFAVVMTEWDLDPDFSDDLFEFTPPQDATQVEFLPLK